MTEWFARPVLHVADVETSLRFYTDRLGFTIPWRYGENGKAQVAQVDRQGCALILCNHWPEKVGKGLMFISLNVEPQTHEAATAALDSLRAELEAKGVRVKDGSWGYRLLVVDDPDGNQLFFNLPERPRVRACKPARIRKTRLNLNGPGLNAVLFCRGFALAGADLFDRPAARPGVVTILCSSRPDGGLCRPT